VDEMKKFKIILVLALASLFLFSGLSFGAGSSVTITKTSDKAKPNSKSPEFEIAFKTVVFTCVGDDGNGSVSNTATSGTSGIDAHILGWYLYSIMAYPLSGGTAPDAADVMLYDANGMDLLGSADAGTTPYGGANLIHATLTKITFPYFYNTNLGTYQIYFPLITGALTLDVDNQGTNDAEYVIVLTLVR
jgi:hypothetical protein